MSFLKAALWWNKASLTGYLLIATGTYFHIAELCSIGTPLLLVTTGGLETWGTYQRAKKCIEAGRVDEVKRILSENDGCYCSVVGAKAALQEWEAKRAAG